MMGSRVNDIKKKFEGLTEASKEQRFESNLDKANLNFINKKPAENGNSSSTRGLIKRSHAFRTDKCNRGLFSSEHSGYPNKSAFKCEPLSKYDEVTIVSDKSVSDSLTDKAKKESPDCSNLSSKPSSKTNDNSRCINEPSVIRPRPNSLQISSRPNIYGPGNNDSTKPLIDIELINDNSAITHKMSSQTPQDDLKIIKNTNVNISRPIPNELAREVQDESTLSSTLKKVLKTPLPSGPPPKKPPRTFAHFTEKPLKLNGENYSGLGVSSDDIDIQLVGKIESQSMMKPVRSKTESQIMLKKLEMVLQNHKTQGKIIEPKTEKSPSPRSKEILNNNHDNTLSVNSINRITHNFHSPALRKISLPDTPSVDQYRSGSGCFGVLSCSNSVDLLNTSHIYDTPFEGKSRFYLEDFVENQSAQAMQFSKENVFQTKSLQYGKLNLNDTREPIYAKPLVKKHLKNLKCEKGPSVLQIVKSLNSNEKISLKNNKGNNFESKKTQPLHYMSSPIWEKVPLLQSPASSPDQNFVSQKHFFEKRQTKSFPSRSLSLDIESLSNKNLSTRSISIDFSHGERDFQIENQKIQKMVNEVYSKCLAMPQDSDSESVASTPDEPVANPLPTKHDSPEEVQKHRQQRTAERKTYLKRVCSRALSFHRPSTAPESHLFEYMLLVGLDLDPARCKVPYIKARYPTHAEVPRGIEHLCFPDAEDWPPQASVDDDGASRCYCVVITHSSGTRKYGYCRRVQPEGAPICLPLAYCIVSSYKANYYFSQVLRELESRHGQPEQALSSFIHELYECPFPAPGQGLHVTNPASGDKMEILTRKLDPRQEETDIARLLNLVRYSVFLQLFSTLLLERKVILLSYSISKLSTCFEGLCAALYPFHWQHTLVPIVPSSMLDVCQAPTPYVVGLLKPRDANAPPPVPISSIDQVLVVDVDESRVLQCCGDENTVLPPRLSRGLREALLCAVPEKNAPLSPAHNLVASEALIALFVQLVGHYRDHIITSSVTGQREFQRDGFVKSVSSSTVQSFLDWFSETTMFTAFIESRLDRSIEPYGLFEQRCVEHLAQQQAVSSKGYRANINKTVKSFGDRFKEWTNSS